jgi:hypothetical protein
MSLKRPRPGFPCCLCDTEEAATHEQPFLKIVNASRKAVPFHLCDGCHALFQSRLRVMVHQRDPVDLSFNYCFVCGLDAEGKREDLLVCDQKHCHHACCEGVETCGVAWHDGCLQRLKGLSSGVNVCPICTATTSKNAQPGRDMERDVWTAITMVVGNPNNPTLPRDPADESASEEGRFVVCLCAERCNQGRLKVCVCADGDTGGIRLSDVEFNVVRRSVPGTDILPQQRFVAQVSSFLLALGISTISGAGLGVYSMGFIPKGSFLMAYFGYRSTLSAYNKKFPQGRSALHHAYCVSHQNARRVTFVTDPFDVGRAASSSPLEQEMTCNGLTLREDMARRQTTSCSLYINEAPTVMAVNVVFRRLGGDGHVVGLVTCKDVHPNAELFLDYGEDYDRGGRMWGDATSVVPLHSLLVSGLDGVPEAGDAAVTRILRHEDLTLYDALAPSGEIVQKYGSVYPCVRVTD